MGIFNENQTGSNSDIDQKIQDVKSQIPGVVKASKLSNIPETLFWESYQSANCLYKIDRGIASEVVMNPQTRKVSKLHDQTLSENHAEQTTSNNQPILCTKAEKNNYRYYLKFNGRQRMITDINLNVPAGGKDIINVFVVYNLNSFSGSKLLRNYIFGHGNGGYDKFIAFSPTGELAVAGTTNQYIIIGPKSFDNKKPIANYQTKANAGELNKWCCLSIHWNVPAGANKSSVWCNGKKLADFTARTSPGLNNMTFGDVNPNGYAGFNGSIAFFCII